MPNQNATVGDIGTSTGQPFKKLRLELAQAGTAAPTLTREFQNTLNFNKVTPTLARSGVGVYTITMAGAFEGNVIPKAYLAGNATGVTARLEKTSNNVLTLRTFSAAGAAADFVGTCWIEVEVWPA
jgi:hypothetical protein